HKSSHHCPDAPPVHRLPPPFPTRRSSDLTLAAASLLNQLQTPGGAVQVKQQLVEARKKDPQAQLWPEVAVDIIGEDYQREGDVRSEEHTSELQSRSDLVCRLLLEKKKQ